MLNTLTWMKEEEVTPTSSTPLLETTSFDDYLNKISLSNPILSVNDAALQDDNIEINQEAVDIFTQPALQRIGLYSEEKKKSEDLSFLDDEVKKEKYNEKQVTLSSMRLNNPEKYKELNETFDTDYLKRFEEQDLPEETGRLFNSMKDMFKDSNVIATPNGYATAFSILMEPQLKTGDQINREKSDFYYFQNDKDFRQKVLESVNNQDAKELLINSFKLYDKEVDPSESFFSSLFKNPNDTETFTRSIFQNLTPFIRQGLGLITKKSAGAVVAGSLGLTGTLAGVVSFGTGFLITAGVMAASGAIMQLEEEKKTTAQADVLDMLVKKR